MVRDDLRSRGTIAAGDYKPSDEKAVSIGVGNLRLIAASINFRQKNLLTWAGMTQDADIQAAVGKLLTAVTELIAAIIQHDRTKGVGTE